MDESDDEYLNWNCFDSTDLSMSREQGTTDDIPVGYQPVRSKKESLQTQQRSSSQSAERLRGPYPSFPPPNPGMPDFENKRHFPGHMDRTVLSYLNRNTAPIQKKQDIELRTQDVST